MAATIDPGFWYRPSFGGVPFLITSIETELGRDVAVQSPSRGDVHVNQDRGRVHKVSQIEALFIDQPGLDSFQDRAATFADLAASPNAQVFSHPILGSYQARIGALRMSANAEAREIRVSFALLAEEEPQTVFPIGAGVAAAAGPDAVDTAQLTADNALGAIGLSSPVPALCSSTVSGWATTDNLDTQTVFRGVATLTGQISTAIDALDLESDLERWPAFQAMIGLAYQVSRAGEVFTSKAAQTFEITVSTAQPLLAICAAIYGASAAQDFADEVQSINRVRTPALVPKGTVLKMPPVPS